MSSAPAVKTDWQNSEIIPKPTPETCPPPTLHRPESQLAAALVCAQLNSLSHRQKFSHNSSIAAHKPVLRYSRTREEERRVSCLSGLRGFAINIIFIWIYFQYMRIQKTRLKPSASGNELSCLGPAPSSCPRVTRARALAGASHNTAQTPVSCFWAENFWGEELQWRGREEQWAGKTGLRCWPGRWQLWVSWGWALARAGRGEEELSRPSTDNSESG